MVRVMNATPLIRLLRDVFSQGSNYLYSILQESLKRRATKLAAAFNQLSNVSCNSPDGALYLFPNIRLPEKAVQAAVRNGKLPDEMYAMDLLEATGVVRVSL